MYPNQKGVSMRSEMVPERVYREPFEILEIDDAALFATEPTLNTCCFPIDSNVDCSCLLNALFGCGDQGCGAGGSL
jgi:hypothetical protein